MSNYFSFDLTLDQAKKTYHELLKSNHPDHGGSEEITKEIVRQYETYCVGYMRHTFDDLGDEATHGAAFNPFADILVKVMRMRCRIEIIGYWIYCFDSYDIHDDLRDMGFWFSKHHKAWIYSGTKKRCIRSHNSTDDNRSKWGFSVVKEKDEYQTIGA